MKYKTGCIEKESLASASKGSSKQTVATRKIVKDYFNSWQQPIDLEKFAGFLHDNFTLDTGLVFFDTRSEFISYIKEHSKTLANVELHSEIYSDELASLLYTGYDPNNNIVIRVAEHIEVKDGKVFKVLSVVARI